MKQISIAGILLTVFGLMFATLPVQADVAWCRSACFGRADADLCRARCDAYEADRTTSRFAAIAFSPKSGRSGYSFNFSSRPPAEHRTRVDCEKRSQTGDYIAVI